MKLVEILAREMSEWPEGYAAIVQTKEDYCLPIDCMDVYWDGYQWDYNEPHMRLYDEKFAVSELASDHSTAIITRADWEAERAHIKGERKVKPNKDGWIRHRGGKCPVEDRSTYINGRFRSGEQYHGPAYGVAWSHAGKPSDLMAWRPHNPQQANVIGFIGVKEIPVQIEQSGPIQWRDRIREIDASSKEEEARHCAAMKAYDEERASLVAKLKAEGFVLIQSDEPNGAVESAQQDMSDWRNWRVGDIVRITQELYGHELPIGSELAIDEIEWLGVEGIRITIKDRFLHEEEVEFVSRPPQ